jgi:hypothetical protein
VYDLIRESSEPISVTFHQGLLLGCLAHGHEGSQDLTAVLPLQHAAIALLSSGLTLKALQEIGGADQGQEGVRKVDLEIRSGLVKIDEKGGHSFGLPLLPPGPKALGLLLDPRFLVVFIHLTGISQHRLLTGLSGLA